MGKNLIDEVKAILAEAFGPRQMTHSFSNVIPSWLEARIEAGVWAPPPALEVDHIGETPWPVDVTLVVPDIFGKEETVNSSMIAKFSLDQLGVGEWTRSHSRMLSGFDNTTGTPIARPFVQFYCVLGKTTRKH